MILRKCKGCGAVLQDLDEAKAGFIPVLKEDSSYCKRCYRMMHYNELPKIIASNKDYEHVIDDVVQRNGLIIFVVDIFAFKATFNKRMIEKLRNKDVILVANKYDVFPKSINISNVVNWLSRECEKISFKVDAIHIVSSKKGYYIDDLTNTIDIARRGRDVYFVGCANVGKSSLINALLKRNTSIKNDVISTSMIPGTTLNQIRISFFDDGKYLIDTPGLINEADILNQLLPISYNKILPSIEMKPITYQISNGNAIMLAGLAALEFECDEHISVIVYTSNNLYIHRCKSEKVVDLFNNQLGVLLTPPDYTEKDNIKYDTKIIELDGIKKKDIWFSGFGFVSVKGKTKVKITYPNKTEVFVTNAIIG
ncbi:MAG: ribosome biogenesis GTPase YqeH [Acholeplasmatales bacterium]|nr:ribosome biogenesis GTPase YqeH [Acholeplasmatales bacterium]